MRATQEMPRNLGASGCVYEHSPRLPIVYLHKHFESPRPICCAQAIHSRCRLLRPHDVPRWLATTRYLQEPFEDHLRLAESPHHEFYSALRALCLIRTATMLVCRAPEREVRNSRQFSVCLNSPTNLQQAACQIPASQKR